MIVVTGATGKLGRLVVDALLERVDAGDVAVSVRDPAKAADLGERGVQVRRGDHAEPATLPAAFAGATRVLVVSAPVVGEEGRRLNHAAIGAARDAGAERVVYTSHMGARPVSAFPPMPNHADTEALLAEDGRPFTALRNGFYAATVPMLLRRALETGELAAPEDGPVSWTTHADLAVAAALALIGHGDLDGVTAPLTAAEAVDLEQVAAVASAAAGRPIRRVVVSDDAYREQLVAGGAPEAAAAMLTGLFEAARAGDFATVDPTLERLLGRRPQMVADVLST